MVVYTYNPSTQEGGELKASLGYIMKAHTPETKTKQTLVVTAHSCNPSTWEAEAKGSFRV